MAKGKQTKVFICTGTGCVLSGSEKVKTAFKNELKKRKILEIDIVQTGCHGFCQQGPIVVIQPTGVFYPRVSVENVPRIVEEHLVGGKVVEDLLYEDSLTNKKIPLYKDINFYKKQNRIVLRNCGLIDPENVDDYIEHGGYKAFKKVLSEMAPEDVVEEIKASGLRGRGGAGFPTGLKWDFARKASGDIKYIICNADEGDPGAFMDRSVLEGDPHSILEGMMIAGYAIGATEGYIYARAEYPLAVKRLRIAVEQARKKGFLGKNILGSSLNFEIKIKEGAGAFVCGEETALMASIEGKRGMPRIRPPFPAQSGLWGKPTNINNVETLANIAWIITNGADKFAAIGTGKSKGTKIFAITGKVKNGGLVEVPMGTTLRDIIFDICGGIKEDKEFKAVQIGGPSGGCLPAKFLDISIDYESLTETGAIVGSGGMVVMDESSCIVDLAKYFLAFTQKESCGKCVPCRIGTKRMFEMLQRMTRGESSEEEIVLLEQLAQDVKVSSLCGLGQTAPNPVLTMLKYFREEFEEHVKEGKCRAGVCSELIAYVIKENVCKGCGVCKKHCPVGAISGEKKHPHEIDIEKCVKCGICMQHCPFDAIYIAK
ncbi:NADH-quinone oxidoreductase subunit NuoF [Candidatus Oleimmundimicrobium sp.]|uniref:NADH-quinone oxidoreductase subunit NuoF n=1 Tax=Candidatus Oleimmundimicrobium sp. TaxID=3060597 RepID=UPI002719BB0F|nr:NADH-quinone oxidoreductase subunit NuoF [Candidatus Oleimmundimicrobium sp.]MDO8886273.1 NADH-quinone oxidoreductase subunit NuoF [Candidatus Oleimmundimicrobium sp.]